MIMRVRKQRLDGFEAGCLRICNVQEKDIYAVRAGMRTPKLTPPSRGLTTQGWGPLMSVGTPPSRDMCLFHQRQNAASNA